MELSRRTIIATALAEEAGSLAAGLVPSAAQAGPVPRAAPAASPPGDVVGKITVGCQGQVRVFR
ncbi:Xylosidase OS=Streptomyces microflavus OX=1919 GN=G3I39_14135 PE=4 SV=1 [Streptomyces microflavus]